MNVFEWQAQVLTEMGNQLAHALATTHVDRLDWKPSTEASSQTRSALDQAAECIDINRRYASLLRGETPDAPCFDWPFRTPEDAIQLIRNSAQELASAVRNLDDQALMRPYDTGVGVIPGAIVLQFAASNMAYHIGQINFIQTLYGDTEFRLPLPQGHLVEAMAAAT